METRKANLRCVLCTNKSAIFNFLKQDELEYLDETRTVVYFSPGETILKQGTPVSNVLSFVSGLAKAYVENSNNRNFIVQLYKSHEFIAMPGVYYQKINHFTITAVEKSTICYIELQRFFDVLKRNADFHFAYLEYLNREHIQLIERLINLGQKQSTGKIADVILYLSEQIYKSSKFRLTLSFAELSQLAGISKEGTFKIIKKLAESNIISSDKENFEILDFEKMKVISEKG